MNENLFEEKLMRVCVVGDSGLLGQGVCQLILARPENKLLGISTSPFKPTRYWSGFAGEYVHHMSDVLEERKRIISLIQSFAPTLLINCAGLASVPQCERDSERAFALNTSLPEMLAEIAQSLGSAFIHISTDQVFDGKKGAPYSEEDSVFPIHVYGRSKRMAEEKVLERFPSALIVRTNFVGFQDRLARTGFAEWLSNALADRKPVPLAEDFVTSPLHQRELARLILTGYRAGLHGIYHFAAHDAASKYEFGKQLAQELGWDFSFVHQVRLSELNLIPNRPSYLALDVSKAEKTLGEAFPCVKDTVRLIARDLKLRLSQIKT